MLSASLLLAYCCSNSNLQNTAIVRVSPRIHGRVVFRGTGKPVVGAKIVPRSYAANGTGFMIGLTDSNGNYSLKALPGMTNLMVILPPSLAGDYTSLGDPKVRAREGEDTLVNLEVFRGHQVYGKVTLPGGKPATGAYGEALLENDGPTGMFASGPFSLNVAKNGDYVLNLPPGKFILEFRCKLDDLNYEKIIKSFYIFDVHRETASGHLVKAKRDVATKLDIRLEESMAANDIVRANRKKKPR